jgi:hypothetical protein
MSNKVATDLIRGAGAISKEIGQSLRQTYYKLENKHIPAGKDGDQWIASRKVLREHYAKLTAGEGE